jgi:hypothetical protein
MKISVSKAVHHFGFENIYEVMSKYGFCKVDAEKFILDLYEEDCAPDQI